MWLTFSCLHAACSEAVGKFMKRTESLMYSVETGRRRALDPSAQFRRDLPNLPHFHRVLDQETYGDTNYSRAPRFAGSSVHRATLCFISYVIFSLIGIT